MARFSIVSGSGEGAVGPAGTNGADALWNFVGEYDNGADYEVGDIVTYDGGTYYRVIGPNPGYPPGTSYWTTIAEPGTDGAGANSYVASWTLAPGPNTVSFTVDWNFTYSMWVRGNVSNGIVVWNAFVTVTNSNVPVIGSHHAWNYVDGNALAFTAIPTQIVGTVGSISTASPAVGTDSNTFVFSITNNSGQEQTVYYGYTKV